MTGLSDRDTLDKISEVVEHRNTPPSLTGTSSIKSMNKIEQIITNWKSNKIDSAYPTLDGCCKVVDIAADLQKELDERNEQNQTQKTTIEGLLETNTTLSTEIHGLKSAIKYLKHEIRRRKSHEDKLLKTIREHKRKLDDISTIFDDQNSAIDDQNSAIDDLKAELSTRKMDSEMLMKVVDIVKNGDDTGRIFTTCRKLTTMLDDYLDVPEDTPLDENHMISVTYHLRE